MVLFETEIKEVLNLVNSKDYRLLNITDDLLKDVGKNNMIFTSDSAFELGSDKSLSFELATSTKELINEDKIILIGKDLNEIDNDEDFMRITLIRVDDDNIKGNELYERLEKIKFTKYRVSPQGYMLRTATGNKEKVRVAKDISDESFSKIGSTYIKAYKLIPFVKNVVEIFIIGESDLYPKLLELANKKKDITEALDHILKGMVANDCGSCSVKELCDEVQELREVHKGTNK